MMLSPTQRKPPMPADDRQTESLDELVMKAVGGCRDSMGELFETYHDATYRYIYMQVRNVHDAEDITGKTWMKVVHKIGTYSPQPGAKFTTWLYTIAKNTITDEYRRVARSREVPTPDMLAIGAATVSGEATPEEASLEAERVEDLRERAADALAKLPAKQRRAVVARFFEGLSVVQTADVMQTNPANVRNLQSRGVRRLSALLPDPQTLSVTSHTSQEKVIPNAPQSTRTSQR